MEHKLFYEYQKLEYIMITNTVLDKIKVYNFFLEAERYLGELSNIDIFKLFFGIRPSVLLNKIFFEKEIKINELKSYLHSIGIINRRVFKYIMSLICGYFNAERTENYIPSSYFLKNHILLKWMIEVERIYVLTSTNDLDVLNHMLVYSFNSNDISVNELVNIIQNAVAVTSDEEFKLLGLLRVSPPSSMNSSTVFNSYEFELKNKKKFIMKIFDLEKYNYLPSGLSTAYLNYKFGFESFGYLGVMKISKSVFKYLLLSIEESPSFYLSSRNLIIFQYNVIQSFYFIIYILELLDLLNMYKTELICCLIFAVYCSDNNKWRYRLEDVGDFRCYKNKCLFKNHRYLISIIDKLLEIFEDQFLLNFFNNLKTVANELEQSKNNNYFSILINIVKNELGRANDESNLIDTFKQCIIQ